VIPRNNEKLDTNNTSWREWWCTYPPADNGNDERATTKQRRIESRESRGSCSTWTVKRRGRWDMSL